VVVEEVAQVQLRHPALLVVVVVGVGVVDCRKEDLLQLRLAHRGLSQSELEELQLLLRLELRQMREPTATMEQRHLLGHCFMVSTAAAVQAVSWRRQQAVAVVVPAGVMETLQQVVQVELLE
jgi:hypothetical protein